MTKNFKHLAILFAFAMQTLCSTALNTTDIPLYGKPIPKKDKEAGPSRTPAKNLALSVYLDEESQQLTFSDSSGYVYTYYIYDEDENIVSQGILDFSTTDTLYVDLSFAECGTYTLNVVYNGQDYVGTFDL